MEDRSLTRREIVRAGAAAGGIALAGSWGAIPGWARKRPRGLTRDGRFAQGVASGVPRPRSISLWTRLDDADGRARLRLEVAEDPEFRRVVLHRQLEVAPSTDMTASLRVDEGLRAGSRYWYRFETASESSPVGRFRTPPPPDSREPVRIGFWTCQDFTAGHYAAHRALADEDLDLVACLGDYIYETGGGSEFPGRDDRTGADGDGTASTLEDYRAKYRLYRSDRHLRRLHARHPFVFLWDDHEVVNNYWRKGASGRTVEGFAARQAAGYRAWFEHQPVPRVGGREATRIYRDLRVGRLAHLFCVDDRQYRDAQPCNDSNLAPCPEASQPGRRMLGGRQKAWLKGEMRDSRADWKILVNGVMLMGLDTPVRGAPKFVDTWDGYTAEREELVSFWIRERIRDVVVMTGDDHDNYAGRVTTTGHEDGDPGAVEFVVPSVTSENTCELAGDNPATCAVAEENARSVNPHLELVDQRHHGYCVLEAKRESLEVRFHHVADLGDPRSPVELAHRFRVPRGEVALERVGP